MVGRASKPAEPARQHGEPECQDGGRTRRNGCVRASSVVKRSRAATAATANATSVTIAPASMPATAASPMTSFPLARA